MSRLENAPTALAKLLDSSLTVQDILVLGYVDRDQEPPRFQMFQTVVALQIDDGYLTLAWNHSGRMSAYGASSLVIPEELSEEPSVEPMYATVAQNYFNENQQVQVSAASFFAEEGCDGEYRAAVFEFGHGDILTVDPRNSMGMVLGSGPWPTAWRDEFTESDESIIELRWAR